MDVHFLCSECRNSTSKGLVKAGGKRGKRLPSGESGEAGSAPSLLARKGVQSPLQGLCTTIERTETSWIPSPQWRKFHRILSQPKQASCPVGSKRPENSPVESFQRRTGGSPGPVAPIEVAFRIPPLQLPEALIFLRFRVSFFAGFRFFSGLQLFRLQQGGNAWPGCFKNSTSGDFRIFPVFSLAEMSYLHS